MTKQHAHKVSLFENIKSKTAVQVMDDDEWQHGNKA